MPTRFSNSNGSPSGASRDAGGQRLPIRKLPGAHHQLPLSVHQQGTSGDDAGLGVQLFGHKHAEVAKRIDIAATAAEEYPEHNSTRGDVVLCDLNPVAGRE